MNTAKLRDQHPELPIWQAMDTLRRKLSQHTRVVLSAPPGAGKSSIVPLMMLDEPWLVGRKILMLEPRRLAARALAWRMADLSASPIGETVGLRTRDETKISKTTRIEVLTEALLSRRIQSDPELAEVGLVIFDEFHERSLQADLGLALARDTQAGLREDLRLLVMSATLDEQALLRELDAPLVQAQGRSYPVETLYRPPGRERLELAVAKQIRQALGVQDGDVLVFLPGEAEIRRVARELGELGPGIELHTLYGRLDRKQQQAAIQAAPAGKRKVVLSTSIAESSVTISGVRVVIDAGLSRESIYDPKAGFSHLQTRRVSRDAADQRAGRAGRTQQGICIRLWSSDEALRPQRIAEIEQADLSSLALNQAAWGSALNWLQQPPTGPWAQAWDLLLILRLVDERQRITALGRRAVSLGAHPRIACMLLAASSEADLAMACDLAALLESDSRSRGETDIHRRWLSWRKGGMKAHEKSQLQRDSQRWRRRMKCADQVVEQDPGRLLAVAFADRIAALRADALDQYLLSNGRGAQLAADDALHGTPMLVVCDLDGRENARIRVAAALDETDFEALFSEELQWQSHVQFNSKRRMVEISEQRRLGALVVAQRQSVNTNRDAVQACLLDGLRQLGLQVLDWPASLQQFRARLEHFSRLGGPSMQEADLLNELDEWLGPFIVGLKKLEDISAKILRQALLARLDYADQQRLSQQLPEAISLPNGRSYMLDYAAQDGPALALRIQDVYGLDATPQVAGQAVLLHLLSPARRPQAVTRDLHSFWRNAWPEVRKQMRGRYPKHDWPEQPWLLDA